MAESIPMAEKTFFSYATVAPISQEAHEAQQAFNDMFYTVGPPEVLYEYDPYVDKMAEEAAKLLNCDPSEITYIKNTTEGITIAADALPLEAGDEVLVLANEYPANLLPWMRKAKDGVSVRFFQGTDNVANTEELINAITPETKAVSVSVIQYYDGYQLDLKRLSEVCRANGTFLVLDAVQAVGVRKIDLQETPVDILVSGGQKYLQAGMGIGLMYVNRDTLPKLNEPRVGIRSMERFDETGYTLRNTAARFQDGTQNMPGIVALHAALKQVNEIGIDAIEQKNLKILGAIKDILRVHGIDFIDHGDNQGNIVSMRVPDPQGLFNFLKDNKVYIKAIKDVARLSFNYHTDPQCAEKLATLVRQWVDQHQQ